MTPTRATKAGPEWHAGGTRSIDEVASASFEQAKTLHAAGELERSALLCEQVLGLQPDHESALVLLGVVALQSHEPQRAFELVERALALNSRNVWADNIRGNALLNMGRPEDALESYDHAIALAPTYADAHYNRGNALLDLQRFEDAITAYDRVLGLMPAFAFAHVNRGIALALCGRLDAALASFDNAIASRSDSAEAHYGRGRTLHDLRRLQEAVSSYSRAIALQPDYALAYLHRASALLAVGEFDQGWADFEWRWKIDAGPLTAPRHVHHQPLWCGGESIAGKVILLHAEEGFGDTLQFCRYITKVSELGATVLVEAQAQLVPLLASVEGASVVAATGSRLPDFDVHCPLMSLPRAFQTTVETVPAQARYLQATQPRIAEWRARLGSRSKPRIGLSWSGDTAHEIGLSEASGRHRRIPLAELMGCLPRNCEYFCLQTQILESDRGALQEFGGTLKTFADLDFSSTAALCECLELVISVDTSIAHLSGALGRPTWILLPFNCDWRWLLNREDTPWYPTAKLYRQQRAADWSDVLIRIRRDCEQLARG
jgi:tetratricopeptide (TPR) repeat protein